MRPRRQTMARGNEAVANYRGATKTVEKETKIATGKSKSNKNSSNANAETRSSSRLKPKPVVNSEKPKVNRRSTNKIAMTGNPNKGNGTEKSGSPTEVVEDEPMEVGRTVIQPTRGRKKKKTETEEMNSEDGGSAKGNSKSAKKREEDVVDDSGGKSEKTDSNDENASTSSKTSAVKSNNSKESNTSSKESENAERKGRKRLMPEPATAIRPKQAKVVVQRVARLDRGSGIVLTLGQGDVGQLGLGDEVMERKKPSRVELPEKIVDICAGGMHTVCLSETGKVYTFGCNDEGALGRDTSEEGSECSPGIVELDEKIVQISAGDSHSAVLTEDGAVYAWGTFRDSSGSMGLLSTSIQKTARRVLEDYSLAKIASGGDHLALLTVEGQLFTFGCAEQGQLGRVAECFSSRGGRKGIGFLLNPGLAAVRRFRGKELLFDNVWAGSYSTFAKIKDSNDIYVCGLNNYYQLGSDNMNSKFVLERSESLSNKNWLEIAGGQHHTLALNDQGEVYALGRKDYGRLGLGEAAVDTSEPTLVPYLKNINCVDVACGVATSYAVADNGSVYAWGMGTNFALGTGDEDDKFDPIEMTGKQLESHKTVAVSSGGQHAVLLAVAVGNTDD